MRATLLAAGAALALAAPAAAHDPTHEVRFDPRYAWFDAPGIRSAAEGRIRLVPQANHGQAALTANQFHAYQLAYRRHMARLSYRLPIREADARARHAAWHEVVVGFRAVPIRELDLQPLKPGAISIVID